MRVWLEIIEDEEDGKPVASTEEHPVTPLHAFNHGPVQFPVVTAFFSSSSLDFHLCAQASKKRRATLD